LIWRVTFQITTASVIVSIVPYVNQDVVKALKEWILAAPVLSLKWIACGVMETLREIALLAYDRTIGLELEDVAVDGCITKAPCGDEKAGKSPVDRGKL
jgi:hypothetical protein